MSGSIGSIGSLGSLGNLRLGMAGRLGGVGRATFQSALQLRAVNGVWFQVEV